MATETQPRTNQEDLQDMVRRIAESLTGTSFDEVDEDNIKQLMDLCYSTGDLEDEPTETDYQEAIDAAYDTHMEAYDVRISADSDGTIRGYRIMVAGGGPTVWVDTEYATVYGYWGGCPETRWGFSMETAREIESSFDGIYDGIVLTTS